MARPGGGRIPGAARPPRHEATGRAVPAHLSPTTSVALLSELHLMTTNLKLSLALILAGLLAAAGLLLLGGGDDGGEAAVPSTTTPGDQVGRAADLAPEDSLRLLAAEGDAPVLVEFLDFECEGCLAAKPLVDEIASRYEGRLEIVIRHMPLHASSVNAARAAEAAAAQGRFADMYDRLFATQGSWGEQQEAEEQVFFDLATELGLDMEAFRATYEDPATLAKIERDEAEGQAAGVTGTPTFFLDGERLDVRSGDELIARIDAAVGG